MSMNLPHTKDNERLALSELKRRVRAQTAIEQVVVFGSVARGEATEESDLDVLVVTKEPVSYLVETAIFDIAFFINIEYDTNISVLVVPKDKWESPVWSLLPLHQAIMREGVAV
ncbi:MAG: nucleotidyltransferase domain-containing protein [Sporomusaceae bacterium]|nr:nucleotidyltransferase domain-containing protein [Sporomusaceae bacterium]